MHSFLFLFLSFYGCTCDLWAFHHGHSNTRFEPQRGPTPQLSLISQQGRIFNLLSEARDQTCILKDTNQLLTHGATTKLPHAQVFFLFFCFLSFCHFLGCYHGI